MLHINNIVWCCVFWPLFCFAQDRLLLERSNQKNTDLVTTTSSMPQILIKAHIVNIDHDYTHAFGINFGTSSGTLATAGGFNMNLPTPENNTGDLIIPIAELAQGVLLNVTLTALEKSGHAQLISDPQLITLDKQPAVIEAGEEVPYQQANENGGTNITFKKAVLRLKVTPEVQPQRKILLHLVINQDQVSSLTVNGSPAINTQLLQTQALIKDHATLVLGGILEKNTSDLQQGIPYLQHIPLIGVLFRYHKKTNNRKQLLIFVTPIILKE